jgi:hypothetical protein
MTGNGFHGMISYSGKLVRILGYSQGMYYVLTGLWPILHLESFMAVTGPKTDTWLVKMVGLLAASIGIYLVRVTVRRTANTDTALLCILSAISFLAIDIYYAGAIDRIRNIYLADLVPELVFTAGWFMLYLKLSKSNDKPGKLNV